MILSSNFWMDIRDYFADKFSNASFGDIFLLVFGIIVGFILFGLFYLILVLTSFKRKEPKIYKNDAQVESEVINEIINNTCKLYKEENASKPTADKVLALRDTSIELVKKIAKEYYPKSPHPISELTSDELILLAKYIIERIDELLSAKVFKFLRRFRISKVLKLIDAKKKVEENKAVKAAEKAKLPKIAKIGWAVVNAINPVYWAKKLIINPTFSVAINKASEIIIKIVGEEAAKVYSKNVFNNDDELTQVISELDNIYNEE